MTEKHSEKHPPTSCNNKKKKKETGNKNEE
jgi:hypothetical protein